MSVGNTESPETLLTVQVVMRIELQSLVVVKLVLVVLNREQRLGLDNVSCQSTVWVVLENEDLLFCMLLLSVVHYTVLENCRCRL